MVAGSITLQRRFSVVSSKNGSSTALDASGMRIMSDSLMPFHPAIEEPSNILPSVNRSSFTVCEGTVTCCSLPRVSQKRKSTYLTSFSLMIFRTSLGVVMAPPLDLLSLSVLDGRPQFVAGPVPIAGAFIIKGLAENRGRAIPHV